MVCERPHTDIRSEVQLSSSQLATERTRSPVTEKQGDKATVYCYLESRLHYMMLVTVLNGITDNAIKTSLLSRIRILNYTLSIGFIRRGLRPSQGLHLKRGDERMPVRMHRTGSEPMTLMFERQR
jgi:hypothetical protein